MLILNISQQYAKIDITTKRADMKLTTTRPQLNIDTEPATVEISQPKGELEIDWEPYRASIGIKNNRELAYDCAELGRQTAMETIGRMAEEGDRLARIESGEDASVAIAIENSTPPERELVWSHLQAPAIRYTAHKPIFKPTPGQVNTELIRGTVNMNFQPAEVNIRMAQYPSVKMWVTDNSVDINA